MTAGVYAIRNTVTGKVYVGSSFHIEQRFRHHLHRLRHGMHHSVLLQRAWEKYGAPAFVFEVLESASPDDLMFREQHWIDDLHATDPTHGYNVFPYARTSRGRVISVEARRRMSEAAKRRKATPETRAKMSAGNRGKRRTPETRKRMSEAQKRAKALIDPTLRSERARHAALCAFGRPDFRERLAAAHRGVRASAETRARMSAAQRGSNNACAKLTEDDVRAIRQALSNGATQAGLARQYGVSGMTIRRVKLGTHWRHVS